MVKGQAIFFCFLQLYIGLNTVPFPNSCSPRTYKCDDICNIWNQGLCSYYQVKLRLDCIRVDPKSGMTALKEEKNLDRDKQGEHHVIKEAETKVMQLQAKKHQDCWQPSEARKEA